MKKKFLVAFVCLMNCSLIAQTLKTWDGGGGDNRWNNPANWRPNGLPGFDSVVLDNRFVTGNYDVVFPDTALGRTLFKITVAPAAARRIELVLPSTNSEILAVQVNYVDLGRGAVLRNSGGGTGAEQFQIMNKFWVRSGAEYIHNTLSAHNFTLDEIVVEGTIRMNVPSTSYNYNIDLWCLCNMRKVILDASAATDPVAGTNYTSDLFLPLIDTLIITSGSRYTLYESNRLQVANFVLDGTLDLSVSTGDFNLLFITYDGTRQTSFSGTGLVVPGSRRMEYNIAANATLHLRRNLHLEHLLNRFVVNSGSTLDLGTNVISGAGEFSAFSTSTLQIGARDGIWATQPFGNIQTARRDFFSTTYEYNGSGLQHTGDGLPVSIKQLIINKPTGDLMLTRSTTVTDNIKLLRGKLKTTSSKLLTYRGNNEYGSPVNLYGNRYGWEQSFIDGPMAFTIPSAGQLRIFPIGKGSSFAPFILLKKNAGTVTYTSEYFPNTYPGITAVNSSLHHISRVEYWTLRSSSASSATDAADDANLWLSWRPMSRIGASVADRYFLRVARYENSGFHLRWEAQPISGAVGIPSPNSYDFISFLPTLVSDFSPEYFTLGSTTAANPMVPLDPFPVVRRGQTIAEANSNSNAVLYPNPVQDILTINIADVSTLEIINPAGQIVKKQFSRTGNISRVDMSGFPAGTYFLRVYKNAKQQMYPFVKK